MRRFIEMVSSSSQQLVSQFPCSPFLLLIISFSSICPPSTMAVDSSFRAQLFPKLAIQQDEDASSSLQSKLTPTKCQKDYLEAMVHRCRVGDRVCFADDLELEDVQELAGYVSEMCCLLRCQPKTLERLCCRNQQGKCRKAKCLNVQELGMMIDGEMK